MKTKLLIIAGLIGVCCLISCKKESMDNHGNLPELEDVDDVCTKMDDINFMKYCYDNFDVNKDGKVSITEANAVKTISDRDNVSLSKVVSFDGIEYFSNLEGFSLSSNDNDVKTLDLRYNKNLQGCLIKYASNLSSLDLRSNIELKFIYMQGCSKLKSIYLPKSIESIDARAFDGCGSLTIVDMSQCVNLKEILSNNDMFGNYYTFSSEEIDEFLIGATVPPKVNTTSSGPIKYNSIKTLKVPAESVEAYKKSFWRAFAVKITPIEN